MTAQECCLGEVCSQNFIVNSFFEIDINFFFWYWQILGIVFGFNYSFQCFWVVMKRCSFIYIYTKDNLLIYLVLFYQFFLYDMIANVLLLGLTSDIWCAELFFTTILKILKLIVLLVLFFFSFLFLCLLVWYYHQYVVCLNQLQFYFPFNTLWNKNNGS